MQTFVLIFNLGYFSGLINLQNHQLKINKRPNLHLDFDFIIASVLECNIKAQFQTEVE